MGGTENRGGGSKDFKKGGLAGSRGGCLKNGGGGGAGTPLRTMMMCLFPYGSTTILSERSNIE